MPEAQKRGQRIENIQIVKPDVRAEYIRTLLACERFEPEMIEVNFPDLNGNSKDESKFMDIRMHPTLKPGIMIPFPSFRMSESYDSSASWETFMTTAVARQSVPFARIVTRIALKFNNRHNFDGQVMHKKIGTRYFTPGFFVGLSGHKLFPREAKDQALWFAIASGRFEPEDFSMSADQELAKNIKERYAVMTAPASLHLGHGLATENAFLEKFCFAHKFRQRQNTKAKEIAHKELQGLSDHQFGSGSTSTITIGKRTLETEPRYDDYVRYQQRFGVASSSRVTLDADRPIYDQNQSVEKLRRLVNEDFEKDYSALTQFIKFINRTSQDWKPFQPKGYRGRKKKNFPNFPLKSFELYDLCRPMTKQSFVNKFLYDHSRDQPMFFHPSWTENRFFGLNYHQKKFLKEQYYDFMTPENLEKHQRGLERWIIRLNLSPINMDDHRIDSWAKAMAKILYLLKYSSDAQGEK